MNIAILWEMTRVQSDIRYASKTRTKMWKIDVIYN